MSILLVFLCLTTVSASDVNDVNLDDSFINSVDYLSIDSVDDLNDFSGKSNNSKINVLLNASDVEEYYDFKSSFNVSVTDANGNNIDYGNFTFHNVLGKDYTVEVKSGSAYLKGIRMNTTGNFTILCDYVGNDIYNDAQCSFNLYIPVLNVTNNNIRGFRYGNTVYFSGNLVDNLNEEEIIEGYLKFYKDGVFLGEAPVDYNGNFVFMWNISDDLIGKEVLIHSDYYDDLGNYNPCNNVFNKTFVFNENLDTEVIFDITKNDNGSYFVNGTVIDELGNPVTGGTVNVTIDGKNYYVPIDTYGTFCFSINNMGEKVNYEINIYDWGSKADVTQNIPLMNIIEHTPLTDYILSLAKEGNPIIKFGNGNGPTVVINAGLHGAELASIVAVFKLINTLANSNQEINGTIYICPLLFPEAIANNTRTFNGTNLNSVSHINGSVSNSLVKFALAVNADAIGDFHCTRHSDSDVGITCVMCCLKPLYESYNIGLYIANKTEYYLDVYEEAGVDYPGALEDYSDIMGIPAVTCEVLTNHKNIEYGSIEVSYNQILAFLSYFGMGVKEMYAIPLPSNPGEYDLTVSYLGAYNYNASSKTVEDAIVIDEKPIPDPEPLPNDSSALANTGNPLLVLLLTLFALPIIRFRR